MILKKQEQDGKIAVTYNSSNILASSYDTTTNDLIITFKAGTRYKYSNVANTDYVRFEIAESQGAVFNTHIKKYAFEKLDAIDPVGLIKEAAEAKAKEEKALLATKKDKILMSIKTLLSHNGPVPEGLTQDDVDTMFSDTLEILQSQINDFLTK